jgi:hypothetical protein
MTLVMLLSEIVHPPPFQGQDVELASIIIFGQNTVENRIGIARKVLERSLGHWLILPKHEYPYKLANFIIDAFNLIADQSKKHVWVRNVVAHGATFRAGDVVIVAPSLVDIDGQKRVAAKKKPVPSIGHAGFFAEELTEYASETAKASAKFLRLLQIMRLVRLPGPTPQLEAEVVALGKDLKLQAPLQVRPHRKAKKPRDSGS